MHTTEKITRGKRRRAQRERAEALKATGVYVRRHRSLYETADIRNAVQSDLLSMRLQMESQRKLKDREWAFRPAAAEVEGPVKHYTGLSVRAPSDG
jgi:hypothetical protein